VECHLFLLLPLLFLQTVGAQQEEKAISSDFKQSIDKFIQKIAVLKKNMKKLAEERDKIDKKKKADNDINEEETFDFDYKNGNEEAEIISVDLSIDEDLYRDADIDLSKEVDGIEDSLKTESSFLDKLLIKLGNKDNEKRDKKAKEKDFLSRKINQQFLHGLREKSNRAKLEQTRLSVFLNRFRNSQSNLNRPRLTEDPLSNFRNILGVPSDLRSSSFRSDIVEDNRNLIDREEERKSFFLGSRSQGVNVNKAFALLDNIPKRKAASDGNVFVFTFADSNNPVLVFDG